jgi:hypothetical protein
MFVMGPRRSITLEGRSTGSRARMQSVLGALMLRAVRPLSPIPLQGMAMSAVGHSRRLCDAVGMSA